MGGENCIDPNLVRSNPAKLTSSRIVKGENKSEVTQSEEEKTMEKRGRAPHLSLTEAQKRRAK